MESGNRLVDTNHYAADEVREKVCEIFVLVDSFDYFLLHLKQIHVYSLVSRTFKNDTFWNFSCCDKHMIKLKTFIKYNSVLL